MARIKGKGCSFELSVSGTYTAIAQIKSLSLSGATVESKQIDTLDTATWVAHDVTGRSLPPTFSAEVYYDPALASHQAVTNVMDTPAVTNCKIKYSDTGPSTQTFALAGLGFDVSIVADDFVSGTINAQVSGDPDFKAS
jgi:hypothetical protein